MKSYTKKILAFSLLFLVSFITLACENTQPSVPLMPSVQSAASVPSVTPATIPSTEPIVYKEYPGDTGIEISGAEESLPDAIFTATGSENNLSETLYIIEGKVIQTGIENDNPYFIVTTDGGDVWISEIAGSAVNQDAASSGVEFNIELIKFYFPIPDVGEYVRVYATYLGMSEKYNYPYFFYGSSHYLLDVYMQSTTNSSTDEATQPSGEPSTKTYPAGMYKVGVDLPAGEYLFFCDSSVSAYVCASSDSNQDDIIENENFDNSFFITVEDGQYLQAKRCYFVNASDYKVPVNEDGTFDEGMYRVGIDIPAGEYKLTAESNSAYWCLYNNSIIPFDIEDNDNFEGSTYVTVREGQYLILNRCTAKPA